MARSRSAQLSTSVKATARRRPFRVMVVDRSMNVYQQLSQCELGKDVQLVRAGSIAEARVLLAQDTVDLALIDPKLPDGCGMSLAGELTASRLITDTIIVSSKPTLKGAVDALRVGATDYLAKPLEGCELAGRVIEAVKRQKTKRQQHRKLRKLKQHCRRLNQVRKQVTEQVDVLCADLVAAYQELADQMQQVVQSSEYSGLIREELDLEQLLRKTLEFLLEKAGATNAAIFLPAGADEYSTAGYVNYDCSSESADLLLDHMADLIAPRIAELPNTQLFTKRDDLDELLGGDTTYLSDCHVLAFAARHDDEPLAAVMLFRDGSEPFSPTLPETCDSIAPLLGDYLAKLIRIHHRSVQDDEQDDDSTGFVF